MTLLEFMQHEVTHEYEKAKRAILGKDMVSPAKVIKDKNDENMTTAPFHPVYLSSMMNQLVFKRECLIQKADWDKKQFKDDGQRANEVQIDKDLKKDNAGIIELMRKVH
jgi:hypothetical protein